MGNKVSTAKPISPDASQAKALFDTTSVKKNAVLSDVVNFAYQPQLNQAPVVLFSKEVFPDPCALLGQTIIMAATALADKNGASLFVVGTGPCEACDVPTTFFNEEGVWKAHQTPMLNNALSAVEGYAEPRKLNNIYHLLIDKKLNITAVVHVISPDSNGTMVVKPGCSDHLRINADGSETRVNEKNMQESTSSSMWWLWLLILLLIVAIIWIVVVRKDKKIVY